MRRIFVAALVALAASSGAADAAYLATTPSAATSPGSVTVRLNGLFVWYAGVAGTSVDNVAGGKLAPQSFQGFIRLYPGFDGVLQNGLKYGASLELRQNFASPTNASVGSNTAANTLYVRRAYGYIGSDTWGTVRFGQGDGAAGLFFTGGMEGFDRGGGWNGDLPGYFPSAASVTYPFADQSALYGADRITYLSPSFYGFDFGFSYAPNNGALQNNGGGCATGAGGCDRQTSSALASDLSRLTNYFEAALRYRATFSGVGVAIAGTYVTSGVVQNGAGLANPKMDGLNVGDIGMTVTYAGLTIGGTYQTGRFNGAYAAVPAAKKDGNVWLAGVTYQIGPYTVGANYYNYISAGSASVTDGRVENGIAAGAIYTLAPGVNLYASYVYGDRRQNNFNFVTGAPGAAFNRTHGQAFALGTALNW
ncbi:porin [Limobrevibacterium gyesilva]|uniref:Porin n=1 Tax=Limobrevibacterium gyesilva TaxID=2991712 RepID=A0AA41YKD2_9PROT|nr:porin [Limobrevibacterium gyesilva]MCW3473782.1 porin [Limobrevibacterium gyesilva]